MNLYHKYLTCKLTEEEKVQLSKQAHSATDELLGNELREAWEKQSYPLIDIPNNSRNKAAIDHLIRKNTYFKLIRKSLRVAALIAIPLLMGVIYSLSHQVEQLKENRIVMETSAGERAQVLLPDGTNVMLNSESRLEYTQNDFNSQERRIYFRGEAYFDVISNSEAPFIIENQQLCVTVKGTRFNLRSRNNDIYSELYLEFGHVHLSSKKTQQTIHLLPNHTAHIDQYTGSISVTEANDNNLGSWRFGELRFKRTPLHEVIRAIEQQYGVVIHIQDGSAIAYDIYTGTFTTKNLYEALNLIQHTYNLNYSVRGKEVFFTNQH